MLAHVAERLLPTATAITDQPEEEAATDLKKTAFLRKKNGTNHLRVARAEAEGMRKTRRSTALWTTSQAEASARGDMKMIGVSAAGEDHRQLPVLVC